MGKNDLRRHDQPLYPVIPSRNALDEKFKRHPVAPTLKDSSMEFYGGYKVYSESGVDLTLLRERLKMTVTERWQANGRAIQVMEAMRNAKHAQCRNNPPIAGCQRR